MKNIIKLFIYFILASFFLVVLDQSFLKPRGQEIFIYLFHYAQDTTFDAIALYVIQSLPIITINMFMLWILKNLFGLRLILILSLLYIGIFIAMETAFIYFISPILFHQINHIWHYILSFFVYCLFLIGLSVPSIIISSKE